MLPQLTSDQEFFRETTSKFLDSLVPVDEIRRLRHDPEGFRTDYWRRGADLGWTSLLVSEEHGGGTISGAGLVDLTLIAHEFGRHVAPGPLVGSNVVAYALSSESTDLHVDVLADVMSGEKIAAWCLGESNLANSEEWLDAVAFGIRFDGDDVVLDGLIRPVESAGLASHLLVTGRSERGYSQVLVPADAAGVSIEALHSVDLTRRFAAVRFDHVRVPKDALVGEADAAAEQIKRQLEIATVAHNAEAIGAMQSAFDMTVAWAFDRYSFGRPLASYQELKHRFADMFTWLQASHGINDAAAAAVDASAPEAAELASAAKSFIGDYGVELLQDCVQIHGGIGVTFEHDIHLFLRRVTVNRALYGTPPEHRRRVGASAAKLYGQEQA